MFLLHQNNKLIFYYNYNTNNLVQILGDYQFIKNYIIQNYSPINIGNNIFWNFYLISQEINNNEDIIIYDTKRHYKFIVKKKLISQINIIDILKYLYFFNYKILSILNKFNIIKAYGTFDYNYPTINITCVEDLMKYAIIIKNYQKIDKYYSCYIQYSYQFITNHSDYYLPNQSQGTATNKQLATKKALSEAIERISYSQMPSNIFNNNKLKYIFNNSNGMATHSNLKKALSNALFESIERDAFILSWLTKKGLYLLNNQSMPSNLITEIFQIEKKYQIKIYIYLIKFDNPIPVSMIIIEKNKKILLSLGIGKDILSAINKAWQEMIGININYFKQTSFKLKKNNQHNLIQYHLHYYLKPNNYSKISWLIEQDHHNLAQINNLFGFDYSRENIGKYYLNLNIGFYYYQYNNMINKIYNTSTVKVISDKLLPIWFGKEIPHQILEASRTKYWQNYLQIQSLNTNIHPFG